MRDGAGRLVYVVGPSGAGKDALLNYAKSNLPASARVRFARRSITRPLQSDGSEIHVPLTQKDFDELVKSGRFAMHWRAHGNGYGIGVEIREWLRDGDTVVVSGSREYLAQALSDFSNLSAVLITASREVLRERLNKRNRESAAEIENRLDRAQKFALPAGTATVEIRNDGPLQEGGAALLRIILGRPR